MSPAPVDVAIVGAGFAGLGMASRLLDEGVDSLVVLERGDTVGGTWRDNTYPGVACDIPSHLYSLSFIPNPSFSRVFAPGAEIQDYLATVAERRAIAERLRLGAALDSARWDAESSLWRLETTRGPLAARALVMAAGRLTEPRFPAGVDVDAFDGPLMHSARWNHDVDLAGKDVVLVGAGASAVQIAPHLAETARSLTMVLRTPPYVLPRDDRAYTTDELEEFATDPHRIDEARHEAFEAAERLFEARGADLETRRTERARALAHLESQVDDPALRDTLTPGYEFGCKRVLFSEDFYPAMSRANVRVVASELEALTPGGALTADGTCIGADAIVLATGFVTAEQPYARLVTGAGGATLARAWADGMEAYASTTVHGFPNLFILDGPNASLGHNSSIYMIETQISYVLGALRHVTAGRVLDVHAGAQHAYVEEMDRRSAATVWTSGGCSNWYVDERSGRQTLLWPGRAAEFRERYGEFDPESYGMTPARSPQPAGR